MLQTLKKSLITAFLLTIPVSAIAIAVANKPVFAGCNFHGCSQSSVAECNFHGCPNAPMGAECTFHGCPTSAQPQPSPTNNTTPTGASQPRGGSPDGIVSCVNKLLYKEVEVCTRKSVFGGCVTSEIRQVRTNISENVAVQACQNAS